MKFFEPRTLTQAKGFSFITISQNPADRRKLIYRLTEKGIDLAPILVELILWGTRHEEDTAAPRTMLRKMDKQREDSSLKSAGAGPEGDSL